MIKANFRDRARELRSQGKTYTEIQKLLNISIPKSTLSNWCDGVALPDWYNEKIRELHYKSFTKAQAMAWASMRRKREFFLDQIKEEAKKIIEKLDLANLKIVLAMLYLGEGAKWQGHSGLLLGSSDPKIILLYILLLEKCYKIDLRRLKCRVSYRTDQNIRELERYWSDITGIPKGNFYKTKADPRTKGEKTKNKDYRGVCVITCAGSHIQLELEEIAKILLENLRAHSLEEKR